MNVAGILVMGLVAGFVASGVSIGAGGSFWAALVNYLIFGMAATTLGVILLIWRAGEAQSPRSKIILSSVPQTAGE
jgi:uncharacterized membrane protein YraQ (UPF0718 family)